MKEGKQSAVVERVGNGEVFKFESVQDARSVLDQIVRDDATSSLRRRSELLPRRTCDNPLKASKEQAK